jgi:myo-inositol 2-dehydrogenase / D-chiro-inositol 1-dehydrogenase
MSLGIGIIGAGVMGADHARILAGNVPGAHVAALSDIDLARVEKLGAEVGARRLLTDAFAVVADPGVDAVLIASPDATHAALVHACLDAGKPVLCEKPLAVTSAECLGVVAKEAALGKQLVQVGFMRRFDPAYGEMKAALDGGTLGDALLLHCVHRNAAPAYDFAPFMAIANSAVHEIDIARWLLGAEFASVTVFRPVARVRRIADPLLVVLETSGGPLVEIEVFINAGYGYDVRGELVCERGTVTLAAPVATELRHAGTQSFAFARDWRPRFAAAYRLELQSWVRGLAGAAYAGASAWDGYVATEVAAAGVRALESGATQPIVLAERPAFYS